jgi:hypothetical protein
MAQGGQANAGGEHGLAASAWLARAVWVDGLDGQEDELEDGHKGVLERPADEAGVGGLDEANDGDAELKKRDEDDNLIQQMLKGGPQEGSGRVGGEDGEASLRSRGRAGG